MSTSTASHQRPSTRRLVLAGAIAGVIAAICTCVVAAIAGAAGVSLEVSGETIPIPAFAMWTLVGAGVGIVLARFLHRRCQFITVTLIGTTVSLIPPLLLPDDATTKAVLVATHLIAAAIIIPALSRLLHGANATTCAATT